MVRRALSGFGLYLVFGILAANAGQFLEAPQYPTGSTPQAVAVADLNGDGNLDIVVTNSGTPGGNSISVLLGNGDGTFQAQKVYTTDTAPQGVAIGDFNGDGHPDIAVTNSGSNFVSIFLGNGDGTFQPKIDTATGREPEGVAVGDFNGDGKLDLAVTNALDDDVEVFLGAGNGSFQPNPITYRTGFNPWAVAVGCIHAKIGTCYDLVVANNNNNNILSVLIGNGDGTFQNQVQYPTGNTPIAVTLADFNGDGYLDAAVVDQQGNDVSILLGNVNHTFATHVEYPTAAFPASVAVGDFNNDGIPDLAVSGSNGNTISILWGRGDGTFYGQVNAGTGDIPYGVVAGDFNNDGIPDIVAANSGSNTISVILSNGNQTFQARTDYPAGTNAHMVATADFNGDGFLDLAVTNSNCPNPPNCGASTISIILGNGDGTFQGPVNYSTGTDTYPYSIAVGDFNGDGKPDLAVANYATNTVSVFLGNGDGTFQEHIDTATGGKEPTSVALGDFNGDGKLDLAVTNFHSNTVSILLGNGQGSFTPATGSPFATGNGPIAVAVADLNGNKKLDLIVVNETDNDVGILLGNGDGTFKAQATYLTGTGGNPLSVVVADFNGDGVPDLALADYQTKQVSVLLGVGNGTFGQFTAYPTGANPSSIVAGDFNGDGKYDLALTSTPLGSSPGNLVSLLLGNGDGTFGAYTLFGAGYLSYSAAVGDFNNDGAVDLAVANGGSNTVSVLLNTQGTVMTFKSSLNPSMFGQSVTLSGTVADSVAYGTASPTGTVSVMNGSTLIGKLTLGANGQFSVSTSSLPLGTDALSAVYSGDSNYQSHTLTLNQSVTAPGTSSVALTASPNPSTVSQSVTLVATVTATSGTGALTGTVTFYDGTTILGSATVNGSGMATLPTTVLAVGTDSLTASYGGNANYQGSKSTALSQVVQKAGTSTALTSSLSSANLNQEVTFTVTVSPAASITPTGTVTLMDGATQIGSSPLNASGVATFSISTLAAGMNTISASYSGDGSYNGSSSNVMKLVVIAPGFSLAVGDLSPSTVSPGASATSTVTITAVGGLSASNVALSCSVTPSKTPAATCSVGSISPASGTAEVTVTTSGAQSALTPAEGHGSGTLFALGLIIPALLLGGAGRNSASRRKLFSFSLFVLVLGGCMVGVACGGGGSTTTTPPPSGNTGTPAGVYTVTVTGTATGLPTQTGTASLTVQ